MAVGAGAGAAFGTAKGIFGAITEVIDETGDILEAIINDLSKTVLYDTVTETTKIYPATKRRKHRKIVKTTRVVRVTAWDVVLVYAIGRIAGWWPPLVDWKDWFKNASDPLGLSNTLAYFLGGIPGVVINNLPPFPTAPSEQDANYPSSFWNPRPDLDHRAAAEAQAAEAAEAFGIYKESLVRSTEVDPVTGQVTVNLAKNIGVPDSYDEKVKKKVVT